MFWPFLLVFLLLGGPNCCQASVGDRSRDFRSCVNGCHSSHCRLEREGGGVSAGEGELSWLLKVMGWTCLEDCQYKCMHEVTTEDVRNNRTVRQFFGKVMF